MTPLNGEMEPTYVPRFYTAMVFQSGNVTFELAIQKTSGDFSSVISGNFRSVMASRPLTKSTHPSFPSLLAQRGDVHGYNRIVLKDVTCNINGFMTRSPLFSAAKRGGSIQEGLIRI